MKQKKITVDGQEHNLSNATIDDEVTGWFKIESQQWHSTIHLHIGSIAKLVDSGWTRFKDDSEMLAVVKQFAEEVDDPANAAVRVSDRNNFIMRINSYRPCLIDDMLTLSHESLHVA